MRILGGYAQKALQKYPGINAAKARVVATGTRLINMTRAHCALQRALADLPNDQIPGIRQLLEDKDLLSSIARKGHLRKLFLVGLKFKENSHLCAQHLQALGGHLEVLLIKTEDAQMKKGLDLLNKLASRLMEMYHDIKTAGTSTKTSGSFKKVSLNGALEEAIAFVKDQPLPAQINITLSSILDEVFINLKSNSFAAFLFNIILNSSQHEASQIEIQVSQCSPNFVRIQIIDDGNGFDSSIKNSITIPGFTTQGEQDRGYGTSTAKDIIEEHGGTFAIDSPGRGKRKGCTVTITLPTISA